MLAKMISTGLRRIMDDLRADKVPSSHAVPAEAESDPTFQLGSPLQFDHTGVGVGLSLISQFSFVVPGRNFFILPKGKGVRLLRWCLPFPVIMVPLFLFVASV
jgi:hypothetical protein